MRRFPRATWIAIVVTGILAMLGSVMGNIGATALTWLSPWVALVLFVLISLALIGVSLWQEQQKAASEPSAADASENRQIMLIRVQNKWIAGFLENELYYDKELLPLGLCRRVGDPWDPVLQNPLELAVPLPLGTKISEVFEQADGKLLILGEAGAGKTTLLLELARDLLERAKNNQEALIPVVLTLSSWTPENLSLEQWIAKELEAKYYISSQIGQAWAETSQLLLLLEGFDEVRPSAQSACIEAVNKYAAQAHRSIVVCSRTKDYLDQSGRLSLRTAVSIQPLSSGQIDDYLLTLGEYVSGLKSALQQSETLRTLATTPLFLKVLILTYHGKSTQELLLLVKTAPAYQQHLTFHDYVERMLRREGPRIHAPAQQTKHWLAWLASQMEEEDESELYLEQFEPDWLPKRQKAFFEWSVWLGGGLVLGLLIWLRYGLVFGLFGWLVFGLVFGLFGWLVFGLIFGLVFGLFRRRGRKLGRRLRSGLLFGLRYGALGGLVFGLLRWLFGGLVGGLVLGLIFGLQIGLQVELAGAVQHYLLRFWLWQARCTPAPWRYVAFLDDAVDQLLLRKVGGGYIFRHRLLQDYFASHPGRLFGSGIEGCP